MSSDARFLTLRAGPLTLHYDPTAGDLRYIRRGDHEIVRRIYAAVRNDKWFTVPATLTEIERSIQADSFRIVYEAHHAHETVDFRWRGTITGETDGTVTFAFEGEVHSDFRRNRIGICVLHPAEVAGQGCVVTHTDGTEEAGAFPELISPHQPFFDIAAAAQEIAPGVTAALRFSGDIFEMEDQRNWLDASFKTYSTPLALPMPVSVTRGTRVQQSVTLSVSGEAALSPPPPTSDAVTVTVGGIADVRLPSLGLLLPPEEADPDDDAILFLSGLPVDHFQVDLDADSPDFTAALVRSAATASETGKLLIVSLHHADSLPDSLPGEAEEVYLWLLVPPTPEGAKKLRAVLPGSSLLVGGASGGNFTELNRERPDPAPGTWDYIGFAGNPQVHAFDDVSILETPPTIATALRSARAFTDAPLCVGPLTFYGSYRRDDPRQKTVLAAVWYFAALTYAIYGGATHVTLCETVGPRGIIGTEGETYPLYHLLHGFAEAAQGAVCKTRVSDTLAIAALAFDTLTGGQRVLAANLTQAAVPVTIQGMKRTDFAGLRILSEESQGLFGETETLAQDADGSFVVTLPGRSIAWLHLETPR
jgi:hypothetical protein